MTPVISLSAIGIAITMAEDGEFATERSATWPEVGRYAGGKTVNYTAISSSTEEAYSRGCEVRRSSSSTPSKFYRVQKNLPSDL